jgi:hypothetical protein
MRRRKRRGLRLDRRRAAVICVVLLGAALRLYPIHRPYVGPDTQDAYPRAAVSAVVESHWRPQWIVHGPGFFDMLRATYTVWYGIGRGLGAYRERLDFLRDYVERPLPFVVAGRLVVVAFAIAALVLVAHLGEALGPPHAGVAAAALLAVAFVHVRESHQVWPDVPAGTLTLAAVAAAVAALRRSSLAWSAAAGVLGGLAIATKPSTFPVVAPVALGALCGEGTVVHRAARAVAGGVAGGLSYAIASPYVVLAFRTAHAFLSRQYALTFGAGQGTLPLGRLLVLGLDVPLVVLAAVGLVASIRRRPFGTWLVLASFPVGYVLVLVASTRLFLRYLAIIAPFVALFAGHAVMTVAQALAPRAAGAAAMAGIVLLAARPALLAVAYDRFLALDDTRRLAGAWIAEHVPDDADVVIPNPRHYVNPTLPPNDLELRERHPREWQAVRVRLRDGVRRWTVTYQGPAQQIREPSARDRFVVTAGHPTLFGFICTPLGVVATLQAVGARPVARFDGTPPVLPSDVVYDPIDADYVPLRGWNALIRPGPNLTVWHVPGSIMR